MHAPEVDSYIVLDHEPHLAEGSECKVQLTGISGYDFTGKVIG